MKAYSEIAVESSVGAIVDGVQTEVVVVGTSKAVIENSGGKVGDWV